MKRSPLKPGTAPMKRTPFLRIAAREGRTVAKMTSKGMKGRAPSAAERKFMDAIASLGCLACRKDGVTNAFISLHHIAGRTAPGAHFQVLPLCAEHHQHDDTDPAGRIGVHPFRARFELKYGSQLKLLAEAKEELGIA